MGKVVILDENTINKIAAGEVVDRPSSIVKELVENSIDAGAKHIAIDIKNGGIGKIKITDDGSGIAPDDVEIAFERHATSKIRKEEDIHNIKSMGFRGEALASVAAVSKVSLSTKRSQDLTGTKIVIDSGKTQIIEEIPWNIGTSIIIENVFSNVPARYKFLKKDFVEAGYIEDNIIRLALANPSISFKYINNGKQIFSTTGNGDIKYTVFNLFEKKVMDNVYDVNYEYEKIKVTGIIGNPSISRSTRQNEFMFVNSRYVNNKTLITALEKAFEQSLNIGKFPFTILNIEIAPQEIDVNVHPSKLEIKFGDETRVFEAVYHAVKNAIENYHKSISPFADEQIKTAKLEESIEKNKDSSLNITNNNEIIEGKDDKESKLNEALKKEEVLHQPQFIPSYYNNSEKIEIENIGVVSAVNEEKNSYSTKTKYKYIGSLFDTYILIEIGEKLYIIDQHAAHERLLYEQIKSSYYNKQKEIQMLMIPTLVELKHKEKEYIEANKKMFEEVGYIIEDFGDNAIKISGVPNIGYDMNYEEMFKDVLDELLENAKTVREEKEFRFLATLACKAAVKGNMRLTREEHISLLDKMMELNNPFTCPHGRPTAYEISKYEIERRFSRK